MVDIEAATAAGIENQCQTYIEEVADHAMMMLLAAGRRMKQNRMAAEGNCGMVGLSLGSAASYGQT